MYDHAVLHYAEIGTKSGNRHFFEKRLAQSVSGALREFGGADVRRETGRLSFSLAAIPAESRRAALEAVARLPGVAWVAAAARTEPTLEALRTAAVAGSEGHEGSFKINARRSEKTLPFDSMDLNRELGAAVQQASGRPVDVHTPDYEYRVEVDSRRGYLFHERLRGPGGLPTGTAGKVVVLLSGGIDSPVAAYRMMLRGCTVIALHLWNRSFSGEGVREKVLDLGRALAVYQGRLRLHLVPFDEIQREVVAAAPDDVRMLLYRRAMLRVADALRRETGALATVTGDAVGQVASQTLQNLAAVYEAGQPPILSPLCGSDKMSTVAEARRIGTYEVSIRPGEDCCGLLVARHPRTAAKAELLRNYEAEYPLDELAARALTEREVHDLRFTPTVTSPTA